jgi:site-specific DNA-methyltransferase (adenine-specific)
VLDPFAGSGTTLVAAKKLGRSSLGVEINPAFCELTIRNLQTVELAAAS